MAHRLSTRQTRRGAALAIAALLVAVAATVHHLDAERATRADGRTPGLQTQVAGDWGILLGEEEFPVQVQADGAVSRVTLAGQSILEGKHLSEGGVSADFPFQFTPNQ